MYNVRSGENTPKKWWNLGINSLLISKSSHFTCVQDGVGFSPPKMTSPLRPKKKCLVVLLWSKTDRVGRSDFFLILFIFWFFYLSYGLVEAKEAKQVIKTTFNVKGCYMVGLLNTYMQLYSNMNAQTNWIRIQWLPLAAMDLSSVMKPLPSKLPYLPEVSSSRTL